MKRVIQLGLIAIFTLRCATAYQARGFTGGFEEMKLGDNLYQVRFAVNGMSDQTRLDQFLLRRCAEITLEQGARYFVITSKTGGQAVVRLLASQKDDAAPADAVTVIKETDNMAKGALSEKARQAIARFSSDRTTGSTSQNF